jgi:hypothetical protein
MAKRRAATRGDEREGDGAVARSVATHARARDDGVGANHDVSRETTDDAAGTREGAARRRG